MAISKRVRFEVLKRDRFRCTYCGLPAPETGAGLTVDHVVPVALGGDDAPTNLVAACRDCNAGKSSSNLTDAPVPDAVPAEVQALAVAQRAAAIRADLHAFDEIVETFDAAWTTWRVGDTDREVPRPPDWEASVMNLARQGAPGDLFEYAIPIAMKRADRKYGEHAEFVYALGIVRNKLSDHPLDFTVTTTAARTYTASDLEEAASVRGEQGWDAGFDAGFKRGVSEEQRIASGQDLVRHHIDGTTTPLLESWARVG